CIDENLCSAHVRGNHILWQQQNLITGANGGLNFLNALLWMARSGGRWRDLPARLGDYHTVKRRYYLYGRLSHCKSILNLTAWPVANIYPTSPEKAGAPKWGIRSRTPL